MGRMTRRGWVDKSSNITQAEATRFMDRCQESHGVRWRVRATKWNGQRNEILENYVPVTGGTLTMDSSDPIRRKLTVNIASTENDWVPKTVNDPLVPFGQWIQLFCRIQYEDSTWSDELQVFDGPIITNVYERPSMITTLECADASSAVDQYLHRTKTSYAHRRLGRAITQMVAAALPEALYDVEAAVTSTNKDAIIKSYVADAGMGRWEAATDLASKRGHETFFDWHGDLIIRRDITDDDDDDWSPQAVGPDIGTVSSPIAVLREGDGGNLLGLTASLTRETGANAVQINVSGLVRNRHRHRDKCTRKWIGPPRVEGHWSVFVPQRTGPVAWGDRFGYQPLVLSKNVHIIDAEVKADQTRHAKNLLHRRRGLVRYLDLDALPQYWLEPDDKIRISYGGSSEAHYVQRLEFDLGTGGMKVRTRQLSVTDPGDLG
jgi:hypothetical protein